MAGLKSYSLEQFAEQIIIIGATDLKTNKMIGRIPKPTAWLKIENNFVPSSQI